MKRDTPGVGSRTPLSAREAVEVLNRIHAADPTVLPKLIDFRVPCNDTLADDATVQCGPLPGRNPTDPPHVGLLGIVNGLFGTWGEKDIGYIAAHYDDDHRLTHFDTLPVPSREDAQ